MSGFGAFREVARSVTAGYPLPYLFTLLLAFALGCLALSAAVTGLLRWLLAGLGVLVSGATVSLALFIAVRRPELLRHERVELIHRALDILGNDEMTDKSRRSLTPSVIELVRENEVHKGQSSRPFRQDESERDG